MTTGTDYLNTDPIFLSLKRIQIDTPEGERFKLDQHQWTKSCPSSLFIDNTVVLSPTTVVLSPTSVPSLVGGDERLNWILWNKSVM